MASTNAELQERSKLYYKFTKVLTLKVAQIVVQSRQGKKITHEFNSKLPDNGVESSPQWVRCFVICLYKGTHACWNVDVTTCLDCRTIELHCII